ncbi:MAG TPA: ImmA/IrrE family metallo-endopeptidase [Nitratidesulfovibrio sp.]|nr:ImmA/IrrE family metallo-endopeptidase [Nitratidesulfovibrio sp.]
MIKVSGANVWATQNGRGVLWTWRELLVFLSENWPWLFLEHSYPRSVPPDLLNDSIFHDLGTLKQKLAQRTDYQRQQYNDLRSFSLRHDLAQAVPGAGLSSIMALRTGDLFLIASKENQIIVTAAEAHSFFSSIGDELCTWLTQYTDNEDNLKLITDWNNRTEISRDVASPSKKLYLLAGIAKDNFKSLHDEHPEYFDNTWENGLMKESDILAIARMTSGHVPFEHQREIFSRVFATARIGTDPIDAIANRISDPMTGTRPYEQGYAAASEFRAILNLGEGDAFSPQMILTEWGIPFSSIEIPGSSVEAIACWGTNHGPLILYNAAEGRRCTHDYGLNFTLAHEICHLIMDRSKALPAGDVMGGTVLQFFEKRANAFAAECILPRHVAVTRLRRWRGTLAGYVSHMSQHYQASRKLTAWQIINSHRQLNDEELRYFKSL